MENCLCVLLCRRQKGGKMKCYFLKLLSKINKENQFRSPKPKHSQPTFISATLTYGFSFLKTYIFSVLLAAMVCPQMSFSGEADLVTFLLLWNRFVFQITNKMSKFSWCSRTKIFFLQLQNLLLDSYFYFLGCARSFNFVLPYQCLLLPTVLKRRNTGSVDCVPCVPKA